MNKETMICPDCKTEMVHISTGYLEVEEQEAKEWECPECGHTEYEMV